MRVLIDGQANSDGEREWVAGWWCIDQYELQKKIDKIAAERDKDVNSMLKRDAKRLRVNPTEKDDSDTIEMLQDRLKKLMV